MTSKVLVKMPEVPFSQVNNVKKPSADLVTTVSSNNDLLRSVNQLQENIRFLQAKHQNMLTRLHDEVDILKQKNRDLQFQLVFSKSNSSSGLVNSASSQNEPEATKLTASVNEEVSPTKEVDSNSEVYKNRCLQMEKELATTKAALQTSLGRTAALQALLQQHKVQEEQWATQQCGRQAAMVESRSGTEAGIDGGEEAGRLQTRLEEAERLVRRLRAETDEQRRELQSIKASLSAGGRGSGGGGRGGGNHRTGPPHQRFPPLQANQQPFWQQQGSSQQREAPKVSVPSSTAKIACPKPKMSFVQANILKIRENSIGRAKVSPDKVTESKPIRKPNNDYQVWNRGNRRLNEKPDSGLSQVLGVNTGLPDLRGTNSQQPYNGNMGGQNQNQSRRGAGNHGYNNHYYRNSERGHRGGEPRNYREDDQHKNYNTPADLSEGENEAVNDHVRNNSYKNKRGHNKHQDKT
ncbi:uncharacterized protein LOC143919974 isoform X2 [Arctopsyche grandis]|uniref:uncharacterized protein LOC143919974 isoform X2 n=1 Tax=Arctopsyche grandis TaxID=121162 RepID=UPI00406D7207